MKLVNFTTYGKFLFHNPNRQLHMLTQVAFDVFTYILMYGKGLKVSVCACAGCSSPIMYQR